MASLGRDYIEKIIKIIRNTEEFGLLANQQQDGLNGISGLKTVGLLQRLAQLCASEEDTCYLEIGVYQGLTLVSTALEAPESVSYTHLTLPTILLV